MTTAVLAYKLQSSAVLGRQQVGLTVAPLCPIQSKDNSAGADKVAKNSGGGGF